MNEAVEYRPGIPQLAAVAQDRAAGGQTIPSIAAIIDRIEEAIEIETASIHKDPAFDIKASNARKSRYLYELNRAMKGVAPQDLGHEYREGIIRLRGKLVANEAAILAHLRAVTEVAALLQDAIERSEADGTYSSSAFARAAAR